MLRSVMCGQPLAPSGEQLPVDVDDGVDVSLIRWMIGLSPAERLDVLQGFADSVGVLGDGEAPPIS